jgi:methionyl-tRNA formyltransferase
VAIGPNETSAELETRLAEAGATLLVETTDRLATGPVPEEPQNDAEATYARRLERADSRVDWTRPAATVHNQIRGLQPWPLAAVVFQGRRLALLGSELGAGEGTGAEPGTIVAVERDAIVAAASPGTVRLTRLQPEGRPAMAVRDFLNGRRVASGDRFEPLPLP